MQVHGPGNTILPPARQMISSQVCEGLNVKTVDIEIWIDLCTMSFVFSTPIMSFVLSTHCVKLSES